MGISAVKLCSQCIEHLLKGGAGNSMLEIWGEIKEAVGYGPRTPVPQSHCPTPATKRSGPAAHTVWWNDAQKCWLSIRLLIKD